MSPAGRGVAAQWRGEDGLCSITTQTRGGKPSLLETLKAAAQVQASDLCPRRELGGKDAAAGTHISARAGGGRCGLQPLQLKRAGRQRGAGCDRGASASPSAAAVAATRFVHRARGELARLEVEIPWEAVTEGWRTQRAHWRRALKGAEALAEIVGAMCALRDALAIPGSPFCAHGGAWDQAACVCDGPEAAAQLLGELRANARAWLRLRGQAAPPCGREQQELAVRGLDALWRAQAAGPAALAQCPLEAVLDYDSQALEALHQLLMRELGLQEAAAAVGGGDAAAKGPLAGSAFAALLEREACVASRGHSSSEEPGV